MRKIANDSLRFLRGAGTFSTFVECAGFDLESFQERVEKYLQALK
jgi:hypothetical protein